MYAQHKQNRVYEARTHLWFFSRVSYHDNTISCMFQVTMFDFLNKKNTNNK